jgi:hypothetical protein
MIPYRPSNHMLNLKIVIKDENLLSHDCSYAREDDNWIMTIKAIPELFQFHFGPGPDGEEEDNSKFVNDAIEEWLYDY